MTASGALLFLSWLAPQQQAVERLRASATGHDSTALTAAVRERPADARELLGLLLEQAGRSPSVSDSVLHVARRVASAYASAWDDSFPVSNLTRFERMSAQQRGAKVRADSVRLAGNAALGRRGAAAAMLLWRDALRRSVAIADTHGMAATTGNIGAAFYQDAELDSAAVYLTRARGLADAIGDRRTAANALGALGNVAQDRGELRKAQEIMSRSLALRARIGDVRGTAADHTNLGLVEARLGEKADARTHYKEALAIARRHDLGDAAATALLNLANLDSMDGEYDAAAAGYREALGLYQSSGADVDAALVLHNLGLLALHRGDYGQARARLVAALAVFAKGGTLDDMVQVRRDLSSIEAARGDYRAALDQLRRAERLLARAPTRYELAAPVALARADLAIQLNTFAEADRQYLRAHSLYRRAGDRRGEAEAQTGRATLLVERKQYARALEQFGAAWRTQTMAGDRRPAALTRLAIGQAQRRQGRLDEARRTLDQALDSLRALRDAVGEAEALVHLGDLENDAGAPLAAEARFRAALARLEAREVPGVAWRAHAGLGRALRSRGALVEAAVELRAATADVERIARSFALPDRRATFLADKWVAYADLALVEHARGDAASAFSVSERMRARQMMDVLARGRVSSATPRDSVVIARQQDLRVLIGELMEQLATADGGASGLRGPDLSGSSPGVTREALSRAQSQYAQFLLELGDAGGVGAVMSGTVAGWRAVTDRLAPDQAFLSYLVTDSTTVVVVLRPDTIRALDLNVGRASLATLVDFARGTVARPPLGSGSAHWRAPLRQLHQYLIGPLEDAGLLSGVRQLVIVPSAELHYLPFAALVPSGARARDEFLVEQYDIGYAPSASAWLQLGNRAKAINNRVLAMAPRVQRLPGSLDEVAAIRSIYGNNATVLTGAAASEKQFRMLAQDYGIVHLATYGVLNQHNPLFSFVELAAGGSEDGRLEVHEAFGLSLNARLLVLSACQTALASGAVSDVPAGDDWVGLVRAFLGAGAENVIATLWAVEDRTTARVMERLHKRLRAGDSEVVALSQAQRETLRNSATAGPFYWAGFVLVGGH